MCSRIWIPDTLHDKLQSTRSREKYSINSEKIRNDDEDTVRNILYNKEETDLKITKSCNRECGTGVTE